MLRLLRPSLQVVDEPRVLGDVPQFGLHPLESKLDRQQRQIVKDLVDKLVTVHFNLCVEDVDVLYRLIGDL